MVDGTPTDGHALALMALASALSDERRGQRFLDLTGIGTDELRSRAGDRAVLAALIRFLEGHEPDLVDVSADLGVDPARLIAARRELEGDRGES